LIVWVVLWLIWRLAPFFLFLFSLSFLSFPFPNLVWLERRLRWSSLGIFLLNRWIRRRSFNAPLRRRFIRDLVAFRTQIHHNGTQSRELTSSRLFLSNLVGSSCFFLVALPNPLIPIAAKTSMSDMLGRNASRECKGRAEVRLCNDVSHVSANTNTNSNRLIAQALHDQDVEATKTRLSAPFYPRCSPR
jgi:hypothetical protein